MDDNNVLRLRGVNCNDDALNNNFVQPSKRKIPSAKLNKEQRNKSQTFSKNKQPTFGICFDVDGVLARGTIALDSTAQMIKRLCNEKGDVQVPLTFVTNALNRNVDKANQIANWLGVPVREEQMIQAQGPLEILKKYHDKFCLVIGQGKLHEITKDLGFTNICTLDEVKDAYPLLDMVDHDNRKRVAKYGYTEKTFPRIEAVILMGEPKRWESSLQVLVDLLKTDGKPDHAPSAIPEKHLPVIACNADLQFMDRAVMPRFGHGAYLLCLEALYLKCTGKELKYTAIVGKPSEITFQFTEHCMNKEAKRLGITQPIKTMYMIGDTPDADIVGANLYQKYVQRLMRRRNNIEPTDEKNSELFDPELPQSRNIPRGTELEKQTVEDVMGILVCTGCYRPGVSPEKSGSEKHYTGHRDFPYQNELYKPYTIQKNVDEAIRFILDKEQISFN